MRERLAQKEIQVVLLRDGEDTNRYTLAHACVVWRGSDLFCLVAVRREFSPYVSKRRTARPTFRGVGGLSRYDGTSPLLL